MEHRKAAEAILACRSGVLGGSLYRCGECGELHFAYHPCNHRNCPLCGRQEARHWAAKLKAKLLPVPYSMVTFTVPKGLRPLFRAHQEALYALLFECGARVLQEAAAKPKYLGASLGFFGVLHTWTRQLIYHPHIHFIVAQGGLTAQGGWVRAKYREYFLPYKHLSVRMRMHMEEAVRERFPDIHRCIDRAIWRQAWVVHIQAAGSGEHAVDYLSRYVAQTALSSKRILAEDGEYVVLGYTESKTGLKKKVRLTGIEFIRRFLQHVLPRGFKRVRYYGWLSAAAHKRLARIRVLLDCQAIDEPEPAPSTALLCPRCQKPMERTASWSRGRSPPPLVQVAQALFPRPP